MIMKQLYESILSSTRSGKAGLLDMIKPQKEKRTITKQSCI